VEPRPTRIEIPSTMRGVRRQEEKMSRPWKVGDWRLGITSFDGISRAESRRHGNNGSDEAVVGGQKYCILFV